MSLLSEPDTRCVALLEPQTAQLAGAIDALHDTDESGACRCGVTAPCPTKRRLEQFRQDHR